MECFVEGSAVGQNIVWRFNESSKLCICGEQSSKHLRAHHSKHNAFTRKFGRTLWEPCRREQLGARFGRVVTLESARSTRRICASIWNRTIEHLFEHRTSDNAVPENFRTTAREIDHCRLNAEFTRTAVQNQIELAGGFAKDAAISAVNQASVLQDGQQLYIVTVEEQKTKQLSSSEVSLETSGEGRVADAGKVNINQASEEELMTLPGIGASKAADIVRYREEQGRFEQIEDIMNISGIKEAVFGKIKDKITVQQ